MNAFELTQVVSAKLLQPADEMIFCHGGTRWSDPPHYCGSRLGVLLSLLNNTGNHAASYHRRNQNFCKLVHRESPQERARLMDIEREVLVQKDSFSV